MKYIKSFEKVERVYNIGDSVIWNYREQLLLSKTLRTAPYVINAEYGDLCQVTDVKGIKGKLYVTLYNKDKDKYVNKYLNGRGQISYYNPLGDWIEASNWYIIKPENFHWDIFTAIQSKRIDAVKRIIKYSLKDIDIIGMNYRCTPLLLAGFINNLEIIELLIDAGANWNKKYHDSNYTFFYFMSDENKKSIIEKYPEKYEKYLIIKDAENYNL